MKKLLEAIRRVDEEMDTVYRILKIILEKYLTMKGLIKPPLEEVGFYTEGVYYEDKEGKEVILYQDGRITVDDKEVK